MYCGVGPGWCLLRFGFAAPGPLHLGPQRSYGGLDSYRAIAQQSPDPQIDGGDGLAARRADPERVALREGGSPGEGQATLRCWVALRAFPMLGPPSAVAAWWALIDPGRSISQPCSYAACPPRVNGDA